MRKPFLKVKQTFPDGPLKLLWNFEHSSQIEPGDDDDGGGGMLC